MQTLSPTRRLRQRTQPLARCNGSGEQQGTVCTARTTTDGFLRHTFLPMYEQGNELPDREKVESGFFKSLSNLTAHYGIDILETGGLPYPHNILLAEWDCSRRIRTTALFREIQVLENDNGEVGLTVKQTLNSGHTLFYIPVVPLYQWQEKNQANPCVPLLLAICSYLYKKARVSYYRDESDYLHYNYVMVDEWIEDGRHEMDEKDYEFTRKALGRAQEYGDLFQKLILDDSLLNEFETRLSDFKPQNSFEKECGKLARTTFELWQQYPDAHIFQNAPQPEIDEDGYDEYNYIGIGDYISFIADTEGSLYDRLMEMVNGDLNERSGVLEPEIITRFDEPVPPSNGGLEYERELLAIINKLCDLLYELT
jgi:hypothetical protein